jgi:hypothetical protein
MKIIGITTAAVLSLILGIAAPVFGQERQGEKQDHNDQQEHANQVRPEQQHQDHSNQQQQRAQHQPQQDHNIQQTHAQQQQSQPNENKHSAQHPQQQQQRDHSNQQQDAQQHHNEQQRDRNNQQQYARQQRNNEQHHTQEQQRLRETAWQKHRAQSWQSDHRSWQQRGGYHGYRIPYDRFRDAFGPDHGFRIYGRPFQVVGGYPRFQYGGYWFSVVDPWPGYWANNWYDTDDVYVTYVDNGYYLYNRRYPSVGIAISISL